MALFSKKNNVCNVCGENAGLGSRQIADGYLCNKCRSKLAPDFNYYSNMTTEDVLDHLKYREENLANLKKFRPTRILITTRNEEEDIIGGKVYVDENRKEFLFSEDNNYVKKNVNLFNYSDFKSFTYTTDKNYIMIKIMAFSRACNSIIEQEIEWDTYYSEAYERKPQESPDFKKALESVKKAEKFFNAMLEKPAEPIVKSKLVNVRCPNCGALTATNEQTATCLYCGSTFANPFFVNDFDKATEQKTSKDTETAGNENVSENKEVSEKTNSKKGKIALKVALGVMTGGVSLIPDAVNAIKKKENAEESKTSEE